MVQLLKRNHDTLLEKYELFRQKNDSLEKLAIEKESMFNEMKIENDKMSSKYYKTQKVYEEVANKKEMLEQKLKRFEDQNKDKDEQIKTLKVKKDKFEG